ncbi:MAG: dTMP kinase [Dehalococcoidia bacterium]|nr:dTMP kinase [Dehalococcoidia bacterium]
MTKEGPEGHFIVLEGGEGAGKSLLGARLAGRLEASGIHTIEVREPGGTPPGEQIRVLLGQSLTPWAEAFAFLLARAELVSEIIKPALESGATVICDRFRASTVAYQGYGRGLSLKRLAEANASATQGLVPDMTIYLDLPPEVGLRRKQGEQGGPATGHEDIAFHERVRDGYRQQLAQAPEGSWLEIDATQPREVVETLAWNALVQLLSIPANK